MGTMANKVFLALIITTLGFDVARADGHSSCFDVPADDCVRTMKDAMMDQDLFWFGSDYTTDCPPGSLSSSCANPDPINLSVLRRVYNVSGDAGRLQIEQATSGLALADVQYPKVDGTYYGCGHTYKAPGDGFRLDPTKVTTMDSWTLDHVPEITWPAVQDALYTVVIWDVGYFYLHGLYINAKNGNLGYDNVPLDAYNGPVNPLPRPNVYLFGVFRQSTTLDPGMAAGVMGTLLGENRGVLPLASFLSMMNGMIGDLVAANMMYVIGDAHSMERQKNRYVVNFCPQLITQSPALMGILRAANIKADWSQEMTTLDYTEPSHLATLTTDLTVEYSNSKDLEVDSCCVKTTFTRSMYRPDPLGSHVTRPALTRAAPRVGISPIAIMGDQFNGVRSQTYTLMMVDMSDPSNLIIHWMVTDIKDADVTKGHHVLPYFGPNPFNSDAPRTYVFFLLKQNVDKLDTSSLAQYASDSCPDFIKNRCGAQLARMLEDWDLENIVGVTWFQAVQDAFARKRLYSELMVKTMIDVCDGQPGFEDPCPRDQSCGDNNAATAVLAINRSSLVYVVTLALGMLSLFSSLS